MGGLIGGQLADRCASRTRFYDLRLYRHDCLYYRLFLPAVSRALRHDCAGEYELRWACLFTLRMPCSSLIIDEVRIREKSQGLLRV